MDVRRVNRCRHVTTTAVGPRALVEVLDEPGLGELLPSIAEILATCSKFMYRDERHLISYWRRLGNLAVFKRLGHLVETVGLGNADLIEACKAN